MPLSYDFIEKPPQVLLIDQFFSGSPAELQRAYDFARSLLEREGDIHETTVQLASGGVVPLDGLTTEDADHFREHWLDPARGRHPWSGPEVGRIMRDAYLDAVNAASRRSDPVPIETFWVFSSSDQFQMRVSENDRQITVFALIPKTPEIRFNAPPDAGNGIRRYGPE
jgi:hypothetical protein